MDIARVDVRHLCTKPCLDVLDVLLLSTDDFKAAYSLIDAIAFVLVEVVQHINLAVRLVEHVRIITRVCRQIVDNSGHNGVLCEGQASHQQTHQKR